MSMVHNNTIVIQIKFTYSAVAKLCCLLTLPNKSNIFNMEKLKPVSEFQNLSTEIIIFQLDGTALAPPTDYVLG